MYLIGLVYTTVWGRCKIRNFSYVISVAEVDVLRSTYHGVFTASFIDSCRRHKAAKSSKRRSILCYDGPDAASPLSKKLPLKTPPGACGSHPDYLALRSVIFLQCIRA
ncbi:unnamed protein product [Caretta caretta]